MAGLLKCRSLVFSTCIKTSSSLFVFLHRSVLWPVSFVPHMTKLVPFFSCCCPLSQSHFLLFLRSLLPEMVLLSLPPPSLLLSLLSLTINWCLLPLPWAFLQGHSCSFPVTPSSDFSLAGKHLRQAHSIKASCHLLSQNPTALSFSKAKAQVHLATKQWGARGAASIPGHGAIPNTTLCYSSALGGTCLCPF